jgi:hypothetical protein
MRHKTISILVMLAVAMFQMSGCLDGTSSSSTRAASAVDLTTTVSLPASTSSSLSVAGLGFKSATSEVSQPGLTVEWYNAADDSLLGTCITGALGDCTLSTALADGDYDIFMRVLDANGNEKAGSILNTTISSTTRRVTKPVNSAEDLAYKSYLASCEKKLGKPCVPGSNIREGIAQVVPSCIRDAIVDMAGSDVSNDTVGGQFGALLEAHRNNIAQGSKVNMKDVMRGDAASQSSFGSSFGDVTALVTKSVTSADAASTAANTLDKVVDCLCADPTNYATVKADGDYQSDPGVYANMFASVAPSKVGNMVPATMKNMFVNSAGVGNGLEFFGNPLGAQAMMETFFNGGFDDITDAADFKKRGAVVFGAGFPVDRTEAERMGKAAFNIMGGTNFANATFENALNNFGPLLGDDDQMLNFIDGGSQAFDNMIDRFGSIDDFATSFGAAGSLDDFLNDHPQGGFGATCVALFDCLPPLRCSVGACAGATGIGDTCTSNSDCDTTNGVACDPSGRCVYALGQAGAGNIDFGSDFTLPTAGAAGGGCSTSADCVVADAVCLNRRCEVAGSGAGSEICGDSRCNGSETPSNCAADCGSSGGGGSDGFCGDSTCQAARGETTTTCPGDCSSAPAPVFVQTVTVWPSLGGSDTCGGIASATLTQTSETEGTLQFNIGGPRSVTISGTTATYTTNLVCTGSFSTASFGPMTCGGGGGCVQHFVE